MHCVRVIARVRVVNGPELKSLASGKSGGARRVSEVGPIHFSSAARKSGDNDASLIHVATTLGGINACWRGRDLITDKRPLCYAMLKKAIRVPVSPMNFNSRQRIEFVKSFTEEGRSKGWRFFLKGRKEEEEDENGRRLSVTGLEKRAEMSDSSTSDIKWKGGRDKERDRSRKREREREYWRIIWRMNNGSEKYKNLILNYAKFHVDRS